MADASSIARRWAQAMIEVAAEANAVDRIGEDLSGFADTLTSQGGELGEALKSPVFTVEERQRVLDELLPRLGYHPLTANLLRLANDKDRFTIVDEIVEAYRALADERTGRMQVRVQTAEPLSPQIEAEVRAALESATGKQIVLKTEVDPSLIGGLVARVGGKVYDSSLRTRLQNLKQALIHSQAPAQA